MAKLRATIRKNVVNTDGLTNVQIAISHHQQTAYIPTEIKVKPNDFVNGILVRGAKKNKINADIHTLLYEYNVKLNMMESVDSRTIQQIKESLIDKSATRYHRISECYEAYISTCINKESITSYRLSQKVFMQFAKGKDINIESIDCEYIRRYYNYLSEFTPLAARYSHKKNNQEYGMNKKIKEGRVVKEHLSPFTINTYMANLKAVINWCIREGWVTYSIHPYAKIKLPTGSRRENILSPEDLYKIKNYQPHTKKEQVSKDIFLLSFYLGGLNLADILRLNFSEDNISFIRKKMLSRSVGKENFVLPIIPEARAIIDKYITPEGTLRLDDGKYLVCIINRHLKYFAYRLEIKSVVSFTSARKAFAQIATNLGISDNYINYILGHSQSASRGMLNPYSAMNQRMCGEILKLVVKMSDHPDKIEEIFQERINGLLSKI